MSERSPWGGHSNPLQYSCWEILWTEGPGRLQSVGSPRVGQTEVTEHAHTMGSWGFLHTRLCHLQKGIVFLLCFQPECPLYIFFSCLITLAISSSTMLNRNVERRYPCLVPDVMGKAFDFSPLSIIICGIFCMSFISLRVSSIPSLSWRSVGFCEMLFLKLLEWSYHFCPLFY